MPRITKKDILVDRFLLLPIALFKKYVTYIYFSYDE